MIHWTRQIKEVLNAQDSLQTSENAGPMEELDFWKNRCADLSGISEQLDKLGVKRITEILQIARSSYVNAFLKLSGEIKVRSCFIYTLLTSSLCPVTPRGFAKLKKIPKIQKKLGWSSPHPPTPIQTFFLETHHWHGQNTKIINNQHILAMYTQTECTWYTTPKYQYCFRAILGRFSKKKIPSDT